MINQNKAIKVALIGDCLASGGAEKVHALLSNYFYDKGLEVHNCIFLDWVTYEYSGSLCNLGKVARNSNLIFRKIKRFVAFKNFIDANQFDIVIDFRMRQGLVKEWLFSKFILPKHVFYTVHSGFLNYYFPKRPFFSRLIYENRNVITVANAIKMEVLKLQLANKVECIHNPVNLKTIKVLEKSELTNIGKFILAVGRMNNDVKQFDRLIEAYSKSNLPNKNIKLVFLGDGQNKSKYRELSVALGVNDMVVFEGSVNNPFPYYKNALFSVLSSKHEGFPNVIIESLAVGTPVISFDCFTGPNEVIQEKYNGLLVENQNFEKLITAMNLFVNDDVIYNTCKNNCIESVSQFDIEIIGKQWLDLIKNTVS